MIWVDNKMSVLIYGYSSKKSFFLNYVVFEIDSGYTITKYILYTPNFHICDCFVVIQKHGLNIYKNVDKI